MGEAVKYRVAGRAAFLHRVVYTARRQSPKFLFALCGLLLATHLLSRAGSGQSALLTLNASGREVESTRPARCSGYVHAGFMPHQDSNSGDSVLFAKAEGPFRLGESAVRIPVNPVSAAPPEGGLLASRLSALKSGRSIYLVIRELSAELQPGILYHVYLDLPAGAKPVRDDPHYVGLLNFFNSSYGGPRSDFFFSYDITSVARKLRARKVLAGRTTITVIPAGAPQAGTAPAIGRVELLEQ